MWTVHCQNPSNSDSEESELNIPAASDSGTVVKFFPALAELPMALCFFVSVFDFCASFIASFCLYWSWWSLSIVDLYELCFSYRSWWSDWSLSIDIVDLYELWYGFNYRSWWSLSYRSWWSLFIIDLYGLLCFCSLSHFCNCGNCVWLVINWLSIFLILCNILHDFV